jgi:hypothetical protein
MVCTRVREAHSKDLERLAVSAARKKELILSSDRKARSKELGRLSVSAARSKELILSSVREARSKEIKQLSVRATRSKDLILREQVRRRQRAAEIDTFTKLKIPRTSNIPKGKCPHWRHIESWLDEIRVTTARRANLAVSAKVLKDDLTQESARLT